MAVTKREQISALALEVLEDAEMSRISVENLVLKASRLARLIDDVEVQQWLRHERYGYDDSGDVSLKYLGLTARWIDIKEKKAYFAGVTVHETILESWKEELEVVKRFVPSGDWAAVHFQSQQDKVTTITHKMLHARKVVSAVRGQIQEFATRVYHEGLFSQQAEAIFSKYQDDVDALLADKAQTAFVRLPQAFERLSTGETEAISHALTTCRRVVDSFAESVFPARGTPVFIGEQALDVGERHTRNRLRAYIFERIGQSSRYERLNRLLGSLYDRVSAGVHSDVDASEARALVLQTYLLLGEILSLPNKKP
jgi:hypothetical protein